MNESINISPKQILGVFGILIILGVSVYFLNELDKCQKLEQLKELNTILENSEYPKRLSDITTNFDKNDTTQVKRIIKTLQLLNQDFKQVYNYRGKAIIC